MGSRALDASAFYAGVPFSSTGAFHTTPAVLAEVSHIKGRFGAIDGLIEAGRIIVGEPSAGSVSRARKAAAGSGDAGSLSVQDVSILALAYELGADLVTDDFAVSNAAALMGVRVTPVMTRGIKRAGRWVVRCARCGLRQAAGAAACQECSGPLRRRLVTGWGGGGSGQAPGAGAVVTGRATSSARRPRDGAGW